MVVQKDSAKEVIAGCNKHDAKVVIGGSLFTSGYDELERVDYFVLRLKAGAVEDTHCHC